MKTTRSIRLAATAAGAAAALLSSHVRGQALDSWQTADDFQLGQGLKSRAYALGTDVGGATVFSGGTASVDANNFGPAINRRSDDGGTT